MTPPVISCSSFERHGEAEIRRERLGLLPGGEVPARGVLLPGADIEHPLASARGAGSRSRGKRLRTVGASTRPGRGGSRFAYGPKDVPIASVTQYRVIQVSSSSRENADSTSPSQSLQLRRFSTIHAASPAGESPSATERVPGLVDCWAM